MDVQWQELTFADRCAGHGLRLLYHTVEAALVAGITGHVILGALVVSIAIGWRNNADYEFSPSGFAQYLSEFKVAKILESLNIDEQEDSLEAISHETAEYGGFLLMMDAVPEKSEYDYGMNYMRIVLHLYPANSLVDQACVWPGAVDKAPGSPARSLIAMRISRDPRSGSWGPHSSTEVLLPPSW